MIGIPLVGRVRARVSVFADDITVFESRRSDIDALKKAVARYEQVAEAKVTFDKSKGLWLRTWRGGPFHYLDPSAGSTDKSISAGGYLATNTLILKGQG